MRRSVDVAVKRRRLSIVDSTSYRDSVTLGAVETEGPGGVKSLLDVVVVDSGSSAVVAVAQSRSPLARLRTRKVQWQECDKCARSDHSSDEASLAQFNSTQVYLTRSQAVARIVDRTASQ